MEEERYNREYEFNGIKFFLSDYTPNEEECKLLITKIFEQAIRDYLSFKQDTDAFAQVRDFLFQDDYIFNWGGKIYTTSDFAGIIDIDIEWLRDQIRKKECLDRKKMTPNQNVKIKKTQ